MAVKLSCQSVICLGIVRFQDREDPAPSTDLSIAKIGGLSEPSARAINLTVSFRERYSRRSWFCASSSTVTTNDIHFTMCSAPGSPFSHGTTHGALRLSSSLATRPYHSWIRSESCGADRAHVCSGGYGAGPWS